MTQMTISQALRHSKKLKGQLAALQVRAKSAVYHQADSDPAYPFASSLEQLHSVTAELVALETRIALTNAGTVVVDGDSQISLAQAVRRLQSLRATIAFLKELSCQPQATMYVSGHEYDPEGKLRNTRTPWRCELPEADRDAEVEKLQSQFDSLNDVVERINGSTALVA